MEKRFQIVTDSSCDLPQALADELDLAVLPLHVLIGEHTYANYLDGREIGFREFYDKLRDGDRVLISEGCTHHRQCNDIGTVKLPNWVKKYTDRNIVFDFTSGRDFPEDVSEYSLVIHCGGCMLNDAEISSRAKRAKAQGVPMTNYGTAIAKMHGILERAIKPLKK